jgi:hypothetical protein
MAEEQALFSGDDGPSRCRPRSGRHPAALPVRVVELRSEVALTVEGDGSVMPPGAGASRTQTLICVRKVQVTLDLHATRSSAASHACASSSSVPHRRCARRPWQGCTSPPSHGEKDLPLLYGEMGRADARSGVASSSVHLGLRPRMRPRGVRRRRGATTCCLLDEVRRDPACAVAGCAGTRAPASRRRARG